MILYPRHPLVPITETLQLGILPSGEVIYTNEQRPVRIYCILVPLRCPAFSFMIVRDEVQMCVWASVLHFLSITHFLPEGWNYRIQAYIHCIYTHVQRKNVWVPLMYGKSSVTLAVCFGDVCKRALYNRLELGLESVGHEDNWYTVWLAALNTLWLPRKMCKEKDRTRKQTEADAVIKR